MATTISIFPVYDPCEYITFAEIEVNCFEQITHMGLSTHKNQCSPKLERFACVEDFVN